MIRPCCQIHLIAHRRILKNFVSTGSDFAEKYLRPGPLRGSSALFFQIVFYHIPGRVYFKNLSGCPAVSVSRILNVSRLINEYHGSGVESGPGFFNRNTDKFPSQKKYLKLFE
ncbi:MAG: hypothetical protein DRH32_00470 [Deltaproteobacteria bacterium]|nr:MAG: hypothetical protein DRH32_00470 [Deltaproteobacteria bacterium]